MFSAGAALRRLIALHPLAGDAPHVFVVEGSEGFPIVCEELRRGIDGDSNDRETDRMEEPSTSIESIWTRLDNGSLVVPRSHTSKRHVSSSLRGSGY